METETKHTVALEPRRLASSVSAHQSGPATASAAAKLAASQPKAAGGQGGVNEQSGSAGLDEALRDLTGYVQNVQRNLQFNVDDDSGQTIIRVVDTETEEVIRQIPSEEVVALARHLKSMSEGEQGLFLQEKA